MAETVIAPRTFVQQWRPDPHTRTPAMHLLFVADPLEGFKPHKDSTFAMMREAASRGHQILACEPAGIFWPRGGRVTAHVREIELTGDEHRWFKPRPHTPATRPVALAEVDAALMRKAPPFDSE